VIESSSLQSVREIEMFAVVCRWWLSQVWWSRSFCQRMHERACWRSACFSLFTSSMLQFLNTLFFLHFSSFC